MCKLDYSPIWNHLESQHNIDEMRDCIVIDCGHTAIKTDSSGAVIIEPSQTEIQTFALGVDLVARLKILGKKPVLNICFSDTTKNLFSSEDRQIVKEMIAFGHIWGVMPKDYLRLLNAYDIDKTCVRFHLQTQNSNQFSKLLKKVKKKIKSEGSENAFKRFGSLFLEDHDCDLFGMTLPYLFSTGYEDTQLGGDWWHEEDHFHPNDLVLAPLLKLKKMKVINLYSKSDGILCPATYGGQLMQYDNADYVAIYSRQDDPFISEKIARGVIAINALNQNFQSKCLQYILPEHSDELEIYTLDKSYINSAKDKPYDDFYKTFQSSPLPSRYKEYLS